MVPAEGPARSFLEAREPGRPGEQGTVPALTDKEAPEAGYGWFETRELAGLRLHVLTTRKFKVETARVAIRLPLVREHVTANALVPMVLRRGTRRLPTLQAIARHLESLYGARVVVDVGKVGDTHLIELRGETVADAHLPGWRPGTRQLEALLRLLFEMWLDPARGPEGRLRDEYVAQEKEILRRRIEGIINNKRQYAVHRLVEEMFADQPFSLHRLGRLEDLPALDGRTLDEAYRSRILGARADLLVVTSAPADDVAELARRLLDEVGWRPADGRLAEVAQAGAAQDGAVPGGGTPRVVTETHSVRQAVLALGYRTPVRFASPDYPALVVCNGVLGGFPHSKLFVHVRERNSLAYFVYSRIESSHGALLISAGVDPGVKDRAVAIIGEQLEAVRRGDIEPDEMEATRRALVRRWRVDEDDPNALIDHYLVGLVNGRQRPLAELIDQAGRVGRDEVVAVAETVRPDTFYFLTAPEPASADAPEGQPVASRGEGAS